MDRKHLFRQNSFSLNRESIPPVHQFLALEKILKVLVWRAAPILPGAESVSVVSGVRLSNWKSSFSQISSTLTSIELLLKTKIVRYSGLNSVNRARNNSYVE